MALVIMAFSIVQAQEEPITIRFYGRIDEFGSMPGMMEATQEHFAGRYQIEFIPVDFGNIDTIIKTAILSGDPADIYFYWPGALRSYIDDGLVLDLTPYLAANDNEWANTYIAGNLELGKYDGSYYAVPDNQTGAAIYVNDTLAEQLGVTIPDQMTWEQFVDVCEQIKAAGEGVFPFAIQAQWQSWLPRMGIWSLAAENDLMAAIASGEVPLTEPIFRTALENVGVLYENEYVYPGDGALIATQDEINAAFARGEVVMIAGVFTMAQQFQELADASGYSLRPVFWPQMGTETVVLGGTNGWIIPYNARHPDAAVEILKYWTGVEMQAINVEYGIISSNAALEIADPTAAALAQMGAYFPTTAEFQTISTELSVYVDQNMLPDYVLGESADAILNRMEELRQEALASRSE
jgi:ABC-type glycerol-3-phosphate transport system substrate-binding protein